MTELMTQQAMTPKRTTPRLHLEHERPKLPRPQNPLSPNVPATSGKTLKSVAPPATGATAPLYVPMASTNFLATTLADTQAFPPDTMGAIGPAQFVVTENGRFRSFNKSTGTADNVLNIDPDVFFSSVLTPPLSGESSYTTDPRIRYDRLSSRWIIVMIDVTTNSARATTHANRVMIAVSDSGTLTAGTVWTYYYFRQDLAPPSGDSGNFADYPTLGVDANACYIGTDQFTLSGVYTNATVFVVRKSSILNGGPVVVTAFRGLLDGGSSGPGPESPQGVDNLDGSVIDGYIVGTDAASYGTLAFRRITNPGGTPSISSNIFVTVPSTSSPNPVPHLGNTRGTRGYLDALGDRCLMACIRKGTLWTAHVINVDTNGVATSSTPTRDAVRWYQFSNLTSMPTIVQSGTVFDSTATSPLSYWMPSLTVSGQGHVAMGISSAGAAARVNAAYTGRRATDSDGAMGLPANYTNTSASYNPNDSSNPKRWGDYSFTSVDPDDDMTMWTIQEFCYSTNNYGTQVVKLIAPPPAVPFSCSPSSIPRGASNVNVNLVATSSNGSGLFDPGAGFLVHLGAALSGYSVTVNSVTFVDPTHATLNLSVAANADTTARTITMTNPDGQQSSSTSGILTITLNADTTLTTSPSPSPAVAGYPLAFNIVSSNNGPDSAANVVVDFMLPSAAAFVSASPAPSSQTTTDVFFNLGTLASGASAPVNIALSVAKTANTSLSLTSTISSTTPDSIPTNNFKTLIVPVLADTDGDGIPDTFETAHGLDPNNPADAALDSDGDGFTNLQEYLANTDPQSATSVLRTSMSVSANDAIISFPSATGRYYAVERTSDLAGNNWTAIQSNIAGTGNTIVVTDVGALTNPPLFYRVRVMP